MELMTKEKKEFKKTDVGLIPEDWELVRLEDVTDLVGGYAFKSSNFKTTGKYQVVKMSNVYMNDLNLDRSQSYLDTVESGQADYLLKSGDIIISLTGTVGKEDYGFSYRLKDETNLVLNQRLAKISVKHGTSNVFLDFQLKALVFLKQFYELGKGGTGNQTNVSIKNLARLHIPFPPTLEEQQAIATALSDVDELIRSLDGLIEKKEAIKKGTMQQLLTGKKRLPGFDGEWEVKKLGDLCSDINDGTHYTPNYVETGVPFYSVENVVANNFSDVKYITREEHRSLIKRCKPEKGDILLTRIGTLAITKLIDWDIDASIYVSLALLKPNESIESSYLYSYTKSDQFVEDVKKRALTNATPQKINMGEISGIPIHLPTDRAEQIKIGQILLDLEQELQTLRQKREKYKQIKQGMMQELLTGRTRLV